jgi:positive regulator of sigma E activity
MNSFYRQGEVIAVSGESADIQLELHGFCSGKHKCALAAFSDDLPPERNRVKAKNGLGAHVGEKVVIEVFSPGFFRALFFVLLLPLVALISGCFFGIQFAVWMGVTDNSDLYGGIFAILFFFFSLCVSRFVDRNVHPNYVVSSRMDGKQDCGTCSMIK